MVPVELNRVIKSKKKYLRLNSKQYPTWNISFVCEMVLQGTLKIEMLNKDNFDTFK